MIVGKINIEKISGAKVLKKDGRTFIEVTNCGLFEGKNGAIYLDVSVHDNRDGVDQYGNSGFIAQGISKEARDRGEKGPIIGNWKEVGQKRAVAKREDEHAKAKSNGYAPQKDDDGDDIPFSNEARKPL